jgi:hypothetical protein
MPEAGVSKIPNTPTAVRRSRGQVQRSPGLRKNAQTLASPTARPTFREYSPPVRRGRGLPMILGN